MKAKFCPKCGKENVDFYKGFCIKCYEEMHKFVEWPNKIEIDECKKCRRRKHKGEWVEDSFQNLQEIIKSNIKTKLYKPEIGVEVNIEGTKSRIKIKGFIDPSHRLEIERENEVDIKFKPKTCDDCIKVSGKYYEYKIQLRRKETFDPIKFKRIEKMIEKETYHLSHKIPSAKMFWVKESKEGIDFFFGDKKVGDIILKQVLRKYRLRAEKSQTFTGITKAGKKKIRFTFCVRV